MGLRKAMDFLTDLGLRIAGALFFIGVLGMYLLGPILILLGLYFALRLSKKLKHWVDKE